MPDEGNISQEELDALLGTLGDKPAAASDDAGISAPAAKGSAKTGKVKPYDFRRPDRFSKDHMRTLEMVHDSFARFIQASLSTYLRTMVEAKVTAVKQMSYEEFIAMLSNPTSINIFSMEPLKGNAIMEINSELMFAMIDRVLGGPGLAPKKARELTAIEQPVVERIIVRALDNLREAWQKVAPIVPKLEVVESNPHFVQVAAPSEIVALVVIDLKIREQIGRMHVCLPYVLLEPIIARLLAREWFTGGQKGPTSESIVNLKGGLGDTFLRMKVILGNARITIREFTGLRLGDVVRLDKSIHEDLPLVVEGREKYMVKPGIINKRRAAIITKVVTPPEDLF